MLNREWAGNRLVRAVFDGIRSLNPSFGQTIRRRAAYTAASTRFLVLVLPKMLVR